MIVAVFQIDGIVPYTTDSLNRNLKMSHNSRLHTFSTFDDILSDPVAFLSLIDLNIDLT